MDKSEIALKSFEKGFNCAQSVLSAFAEDFGLKREDALKIATSFGGGMAKMGETCGAVTGALMVIGLKFGKVEAQDNNAKEITYRKVNEFVTEFKARNSFLNCRDLLASDPANKGKDTSAPNLSYDSCPKYVSDAVEILTALLED